MKNSSEAHIISSYIIMEARLIIHPTSSSCFQHYKQLERMLSTCYGLAAYAANLAYPTPQTLGTK